MALKDSLIRFNVTSKYCDSRRYCLSCLVQLVKVVCSYAPPCLYLNTMRLVCEAAGKGSDYELGRARFD